jgi:hypothetical protein
MSRRVLSARHSICIGFSLALPTGEDARPANIVPARFGSRHAYVTFFPMLDEIRVNMFSYRELDDPWVASVRKAPLDCLAQDFPEAAAALAGLALVRPPEIRSTFHAPCPASGTGMTRILNDVERLSGAHLPQWLATPGMDADKIAAFYADPLKLAVDKASLNASMRGRHSAIDLSLYGRMRRTAGKLKRLIADAREEARGRLKSATTAAGVG